MTDPERGDAAARLAALAAQTEPRPADLAFLRDCLGDASKPIQRRAAELCAELAVRGWPIAALLEAAAAAPDLRRRWGAAYAAARLGVVPSAARATLIEVLGDADGDLRWAAADLLKRLAERERAAVVGDLVAAAHAEPSRRKMAFYCLRDLAAPEGLEVAERSLHDDASEIRLAALAYVAAIEPDRDRAALRVASLLDDADSRVRRAAAGTLGSMGVRHPLVTATLRRAVQSADESVRRAAARSLRLLGESR